MLCRIFGSADFVHWAATAALAGMIVLATSPSILARESNQKPTHVANSDGQENHHHYRRQYLRDDKGFQGHHVRPDWSERGRSAPSAAALRLRAYRQKMAMRSARPAAVPRSPTQLDLAAAPTILAAPTANTSFSSAPASWLPLGPAPMASDASGDGMQDYNWVSGRATSVVIDPSDETGNTVLSGGAYGGLWRSTNAGSLSSNPALAVWQSLIDHQPSLSVGAIALQPGNSSVILVGTGETNSSSDSYYGLGILRSADSGATWTLITGVTPPGAPTTDQTFLGIGFSKIAFSTSNPNLVVAATAGDNGLDLGLEEDGDSTARGLYFSQDAGLTWNRVTLSDGAVPASATSIVFNASQGAPTGTLYAFVRRHGLYSSTDGQHFAPVTTQPSPGLTTANCPPSADASTCPIYRGEIAVVPDRNEMYVWMVDVQPDADGNPTPIDQGIWKSLNGGASWTQVGDNGITNCGDNAFGPNSGCGVEQGWYNLELAAIPNGALTDLYAGAVNLYKCTLAGGTTCAQGDWINLTHVYGCNPGPLAAPAHVHPNQHGMAFLVVGAQSPGYFAHDGGISRTLDGYGGLNAGSCAGTNQFDSLSQPQSAANSATMGSMAELVSLSIDPSDPNILLGGAQDEGSPATGTASTSLTWQNALGGDGGSTAINPANSNEWFTSNPYLAIFKCEAGSGCDDSGFTQIVGSNDLGGDGGAYDTPFILDPQNSAELLVGTCRIWRIGTSGESPMQLSDDFDTLGAGVCTGDETNLVTAIAAGGPEVSGFSSVVYAVTDGVGPLTTPDNGPPGGEVWVTSSAGATLMTNVSQNINPNGYAISSVVIDSSDATGNTAYVGIMGFSTPAYPTSHVWKTTTAGASWIDWSGSATNALPDNPVNVLLVDSQAGQVFAGTDVGVFVSSTTAPGWVEAGPPPSGGSAGFLPNAPVTSLRLFNPDAVTKTVVASTYGRGVWSYPLMSDPDFSITVGATPNTAVVKQTVNWTGTLTALNGYAGTATLSCSQGAPATCAISPTTLTPTANGTAFTATLGNATPGLFEFSIVATDGMLTHATPNEMLTVESQPAPDFAINLAASPTATTVNQTVVWSGTLSSLNGYSGTVALSCGGGAPATCMIAPATLMPSGTGAGFTVTLASATTGVFNFAILATDGTITHSTPAETLTVTGAAPNFTIAVVASSTTTLINQNVTWNGTLTAIDGFSGIVSLSCAAGAPATCQITPASLTPTSNGAPFTVTVGSASAGAFTFAIQGTSGSLTNDSPSETLTVESGATGVTWTNTGSPTASLLAGRTATYTFSAAPAGGSLFTSEVDFACANPPTLTGCTFSPVSIAAGAGAMPVTLTIWTCGPNLPTLCPDQIPSGDNSRAYAAIGPPPNSRSPAPPWLTLAWLTAITTIGIRPLIAKRRGQRAQRAFTTLCLGIGLSVVLLAELSCGALSGAGGGSEPPVTVSPTSATLFANEPGNSWPSGSTQQKFTANQSVTWAVTGSPLTGTIASTDGTTGLYSAPAVAVQGTVAVTATSSSSSGAGFVTVEAPTPLGTSPITVTAAVGSGAPQSATVTLVVE